VPGLTFCNLPRQIDTMSRQAPRRVGAWRDIMRFEEKPERLLAKLQNVRPGTYTPGTYLCSVSIFGILFLKKGCLMSRPLRLTRPCAFYHVMLRGNNGQAIFFVDADKQKCLSLLGEGVELFGHRIHSFCFMPNHIHLLVQVGENSISQPMHHLSSCYTKYVNLKENRSGHLFQGRFKSILIADNEYLLQLVRYIHLNPVRAKMVNVPENYSWSSHGVYLGNTILPWLTQVHILTKFDPYLDDARKKFDGFVKYEMYKDEDKDQEELFENGSHKGMLLGSDDFAAKIFQGQSPVIQQPSYTLDTIINIVCDVLQVSREIIYIATKERQGVRVRAFIAVFVQKAPHLSLKEFADLVKRDSGVLGRQAGQLVQLCKSEAMTAQLFSEIACKLNALLPG
jgi:putative transposase